MPFDLDSPPPEIVEKAALAIRQGKVVLYPTDTLYGLGCDPFNEEALQRLFGIKGRSETKGVLLLVQDYSYAKVVSDHIPDLFYELVEAFWPGPVTLLLEGTPPVPAYCWGRRVRWDCVIPTWPFYSFGWRPSRVPSSPPVPTVPENRWPNWKI